MLSVFDVRFPECLCWNDAGDDRSIQSDEKLSVVSLVPPTPVTRLVSIPEKDHAFCKGAADLGHAIPDHIRFLDVSLEQLLKRTEARVEICAEIGEGPSIASLKTSTENLSAADRALISRYIGKNWPIEQLVNAGTMQVGQKYHLEMEVLFTPAFRVYTL